MGRIKKTRRLLTAGERIAYSYSDPSAVLEETTAQGTRLKFLDSGVLTLENDTDIDVFLVGGGGGGGYGTHGGGGGAGYTRTQKGVGLFAGVEYEIIIGDGGSGATSVSQSGGNGGKTEAFGYAANGGNGGGSYSSGNRKGGNGGSGGGAGSANTLGGVDGGDGEDNGIYSGGAGQVMTTRAFGESSEELYSTGGRGSDGTLDSEAGAPNTGNGGSGGKSGSIGAAGGSGIVIVRRKKNAADNEVGNVLMLYNSGWQNEDVTGGWTTYTGGGVSVNLGDDAIVFANVSTSGRYACAYANKKIDVTEYNKLCMNVSDVSDMIDSEGSDLIVALFLSNPSTSGSVSTDKRVGAAYANIGANSVFDEERTFEVDISTFEGEYYVQISAAIVNAKVRRVWLEK